MDERVLKEVGGVIKFTVHLKLDENRKCYKLLYTYLFSYMYVNQASTVYQTLISTVESLQI